MTTTESFSALMPEPAVRAVYATAKNTPAVKSGTEMSGYMKAPDYYTAEQMRAMFDAATERAAKQEREDGKLLDALHRNSWDLVAFDIPTGSGDADIGWRVIGHFMSAPTERTMGEVFEDDPRGAIAAAIRGEGGST